MTHPQPAAEDRVVIANIPVDRMTAAAWTFRMVQDWKDKKTTGAPPKVVTTVNGQVVSLAAQNKAYHDALLAADHVAADGMSTVFASKIVTDSPLVERVSTTDWFHSAAEAACIHGIKFYMLGASLDVIGATAQRVRRQYPMLPLVGWRDGYFDRNKIEDVAASIRATGADVLWIGVGNPEQLLLAHRLKALLPRLTWIRTCGGLFDFLSGSRSRAPELMQQLGLEWTYRMALEPRRLGWRYATTNVHSTYLMAKYSRSYSAASDENRTDP